MSDAPSIWEDDLPVGTKVQITYSNGKHRDGIILEHRADGLLKLATNRNPALGGVFFANPRAHHRDRGHRRPAREHRRRADSTPA